MKDFEKIYSKIKERVEFVQTDTRNSDKEINSYARKKLLKVILNIILIFLVLIFITKNLEFLFLLPFVFPPLFIYYLFVKGDRRETTHNPNINILTNQIFSSIIDDGFDGLTYCVNENGMDKEVYYKGHFRKCDEYFSKAELKGIINNINKLEMSYVGTLDRYLKREVDFTFRGYVLLIDLNKDTNMKIRIDNKKIKLLDEQKLYQKKMSI